MARIGRVALFITCINDLLFPEVGEAAVKVLRHLGVEVDFPVAQTCCGQPAYTGGYSGIAREMGEELTRVFAEHAVVVTPSGSCASMVARHYRSVGVAAQPALAERIWDFSAFLTQALGVVDVGAQLAARAVYHPSCHLTRGLGQGAEPLRLLQAVAGLELLPLADAHECCGFGGSFAAKLPELSAAIADDKLRRVVASGADRLVGADMGCLMHLGGRMRRLGIGVKTQHVAQVLAEGLGA